jgi:hypothetical protein
MLLADLYLGIMPGSRRVSAIERRLHSQFGLLLGSGLQHPSGQHHRNLPARQLSRKWPGVLGDWALLLRLGLSERERHNLHGRRSYLHLRCSAELAQRETPADVLEVINGALEQAPCSSTLPF